MTTLCSAPCSAAAHASNVHLDYLREAWPLLDDGDREVFSQDVDLVLCQIGKLRRDQVNYANEDEPAPPDVLWRRVEDRWPQLPDEWQQKLSERCNETANRQLHARQGPAANHRPRNAIKRVLLLIDLLAGYRFPISAVELHIEMQFRFGNFSSKTLTRDLHLLDDMSLVERHHDARGKPTWKLHHIASETLQAVALTMEDIHDG